MSADVRNSAPNPSEVAGEEYASSLADLTVNSKPLINMLTMLAEENVDYADAIVKVIEKHLSQVKPEMKLPVLYLVDSIVKNIGRDYTTLFTQNIVSTFCGVFEKVDESTRASMFKLRQTWSDVFPLKKLYALDVRVKSIDPAWPITAPLPTAASIHLNPAFLPKSGSGSKGSVAKTQPSQVSTRTPVTTVATPVPVPATVADVPAPTSLPGDLTEIEMRENLLRKRKELIELQQKKIEIEYLQTKARLQQQQLQQQFQAVPLLPPEPPVALSSLKPAIEELAKGPKVAEAPKPETAPPVAKIEPEELKIPPHGSVQRAAVRRSKTPEKSSGSPSKKFKEDRSAKDKEKRKRKDSSSSNGGNMNNNKDRPRKGKESGGDVEEDRGVEEADGQPPKLRNLREAAKSMPRIPKISDRSAAAAPRDPRLQHKQPAAERRKIQEASKKDQGVDHKKRRRFDDLFGNEDIDLRKVPTPSGPPTAAPVPRDSPPRGGHWGPKRGAHRGRGWAGPPRGGRGGRRPMGDEPPGPWMEGPGEDSWEGPMGPEDSSPQNMDIILEQAKENHRNGVINDGEYSTIIRQMFQMSESKMIREVQRRDQDLRYAGPSWNEPAGRERDPRRFPNYPAGRPSRFGDRMPPGRMNAFEVRPDEGPIKTINIDNIAREIRFYGDTAIILMAAEDPRELGFQPGVRRVFIDNVMAVECVIGSDYVDFTFEGCIHQIKLGAPTRELYVNGQWYECMFGGPPVTVPLGNRPVQMALEAPPPTVKIGNERRLDLLAGRVTMIIDAHSVIPVYLDLKLQHFDLDGKVYTLQFKDSLRTVVVDNIPYRVDFGGLPMAIQLDGRKHFVRFPSLPRGVEPGRVLQPFQSHPHMRQEEQVQLPMPFAPSATAPSAPMDVSELLSKLMATGLLPSATTGTPETKPVAREEPSRQVDKARANEEPKIEDMRDVNLKDSESMKIRPNLFVSLLYSGMQCGSCGLRFPAEQTVRYSAHLDWHFRQNRREKGASKRPQSRKWYYKVTDWIQFEETESVENDKRLNWFEAQASDSKDQGADRNGDDLMSEETSSVPVGAQPEDNRCAVCHENLEQFFHEESEEWHLKDAVRIDGVAYHRLCSRDYLSREPYSAESAEEPTASEAEEATMESASEDELERKVKTEVAESPATSCDMDSLPPVKEDHEDTVDSAEATVNLERVTTESNEAISELEPIAEESGQETATKADEPPCEADLVPEEALDSIVADSIVAEPLPSVAEPLPSVAEPLESVAEASEEEERPATPPPEEASVVENTFIPEAVNSTPTVVSSIDGNVELPAAEVAPVVTAPPKIKINLFKKVAVPSPQAPPSPPKSPNLGVTPGTTTTDDTRLSLAVSNVAGLTKEEQENDEIPPPPDEAALANKPRLIGRKLTVLPPKNKGTELSGLCSIM